MKTKTEYKKGHSFNGFIYLKDVEKRKGKRFSKFLCRLCNKSFIANFHNVSHSLQKSCGCYSTILENHPRYKHGDSGKKHYLYKLWKSIKGRCYNPNTSHYKHYGGRGIVMYIPWEENYTLFKVWILEYLGERPSPKHSIDRIDNDQGYFPENLRWATAKEQANNTRGHSLNDDRKTEIIISLLPLDIMTIQEIAKYFNISVEAVERIKIEKLIK